MKTKSIQVKEAYEIVETFNRYVEDKVKIRFKNLHPVMRLYKSDKISYIGNTIWIPSYKWMLDPVLITGMLAHEFAHKLDRDRDGILYNIRWWFSRKWRFIYEARAFSTNLIVILYFCKGKYPDCTEKQLFDTLTTTDYRRFFKKDWDSRMKKLAPRLMHSVKYHWDTDASEVYPTKDGINSKSLYIVINLLKRLLND